MSQHQVHKHSPALQEIFKICYQAKRLSMNLAWMLLENNKIVGRNGGTRGTRTDAFINLDTNNQVVLCGDGNGGTFPVAIDLVS